MRLLMDSSSLRRLELIELLNSKDEWWTIEEIALHLNCSVRSVKADIYYYNTFSQHSIKLVTSNHHGVKLNLPATFQMESVYQEILAENLCCQILEYLYQEKQYTVEEYAEKLFTSTSSILRCVKQINLFLKDYNLTIQKKPMKIVGSEKQIRYFYSLFFWEKSGTKVGIAKYLDVSKAVEIVQELAVRTNVDLSPIMENELSVYLLIVLERISKGRTLDHYNAPIEVTKEVVNIIEELLKDKSIIVAKQEIEFMGFYYMNRYLKPNLTNHYATIEIVETFKQIDQFLTSFSEKHSFILTNKAVLQRRIFHYIMYKKEFQGSNFFFIDRAKKTLHQIDKIYHSFINLARSELEDWSFGDLIPKTNEETLGFLYILIINWEGLTSQVIQLQTKINVLIISHFGKNHELFLADILKNYFPNELKCYSLAENKFQNSEIDVVVTDSQIKEIRKNIIETIPIIGIDYAPNERNWKTIRTILTEIKQTNEKCNYQINAYSPFPSREEYGMIK